MADGVDRVVAIHDALISAYDALLDAYDDSDDSTRAHDLFIELLSTYTSAVALSASRAFAELLGIDTDSVELLQLTDAQYHALEASGMLDVYIDGKDTVDD